MWRATLGVLVVAFLAVTAPIAQATLVSTSTVVFGDNYESGIVGSPPGVNDPVVGTWTVRNDYGTGASITVEDASTAGFAAYEGSQFLKIFRPAGGSASMSIVGNGIASGATDTVKMELAFRLDGEEGNFILLDSSSNQIAQIGIWGPNAWGVPYPTVAVLGDGGWQYLTQTHNLGAWNTLALTHQNGTADWTVSVNGAMPESKTSYAAGTTPWSGFVLDSGGSVNMDTSWWIDASGPVVPEPSTVVLLATGLIGSLAYAWKKWK